MSKTYIPAEPGQTVTLVGPWEQRTFPLRGSIDHDGKRTPVWWSGDKLECGWTDSRGRPVQVLPPGGKPNIEAAQKIYRERDHGSLVEEVDTAMSGLGSIDIAPFGWWARNASRGTMLGVELAEDPKADPWGSPVTAARITLHSGSVRVPLSDGTLERLVKIGGSLGWTERHADFAQRIADAVQQELAVLEAEAELLRSFPSAPAAQMAEALR